MKWQKKVRTPHWYELPALTVCARPIGNSIGAAMAITMAARGQQGQSAYLASYHQDKRRNIRYISNWMTGHAELLKEFVKTFEVRPYLFLKLKIMNNF